MKKLLIALAAVFITAAASYAQGTVNFATKVGTAVDAPVTLQGTTTGVGPDYSAQLYLSSGGSLTALTPVTTFRATPAAAVAYVNSVTVEVPGITAGNPATLVMRAWKTSLGSSYEAALAAGMGGVGESSPVTVTLGGGISVPANLVGLQGFSVTPVTVPEPTILALGALGASALLLRRRK